MAKQKTTGQGVVEALKGVSETGGNMGAVYGAAFTKGLQSGIAKSTARKKEREAENKAILKAAGAYMANLDSNVDTVGLDFSDQDKAEVKRVSIEWRNEFADYANQLARIEDKSSAEALELQDKMNGIKSRFNNLRANLDGVAKYKQEFSLNIDLDGDGEGRTLYSTAGANKERLAQGKAMLTESFAINDEGGIVYADQTISEEVPAEVDKVWGEEISLEEGATKSITRVTTPGFTYQHNNFKKPFEQAVGAVNGLTALYNEQASLEGAITDGEKDVLTQLVQNQLKGRGALESFIADNDQLTKIFDLTDLSLDDGAKREEVERQVVDRLVETMAGARKPKSRRVQNLSVTQVTVKEREKAFKENRIQIAGPKSGQFWTGFTKDGKKITYEGGVLTTNEKPAYYVLYDDQGPVPNYANIPAGNMQLWQSINN